MADSGQSGGRSPRCEHDEGMSYWGGCEARARYHIERADTEPGYVPASYCPAHVADAIAYLADGDDVPITVHILFDEPPSRARSETS